MLPENRADLIELLRASSPAGEEIRFTPEQLEMLNSEMERWKRSEPEFFEEGVAVNATVRCNSFASSVRRLNAAFNPTRLGGRRAALASRLGLSKKSLVYRRRTKG